MGSRFVLGRWAPRLSALAVLCLIALIACSPTAKPAAKASPTPAPVADASAPDATTDANAPRTYVAPLLVTLIDVPKSLDERFAWLLGDVTFRPVRLTTRLT